MNSESKHSISLVYEQLIQGCPEGIAYLFDTRLMTILPIEELAQKYEINEADTVEEFRRFIAIKVFTRDHDAVRISPTPLMDELWHAAILDTRFYAGLQEALSCVLHHRPRGASLEVEESSQRRTRLAALKAYYASYFSGEPIFPDYPDRRPPPSDPEWKYPLRIHVKTLTGKSMGFNTSKNATILELKWLITDKEDIPFGHQRLIHGGKQLEDQLTLEHYGVKDEDIVHLVLRLC